MKNLENFGVQEMNTQEMSKVEGGSFPWFGYTLDGWWELMMGTTSDSKEDYIQQWADQWAT